QDDKLLQIKETHLNKRELSIKHREELLEIQENDLFKRTSALKENYLQFKALHTHLKLPESYDQLKNFDINNNTNNKNPTNEENINQIQKLNEEIQSLKQKVNKRDLEIERHKHEITKLEMKLKTQQLDNIQ